MRPAINANPKSLKPLDNAGHGATDAIGYAVFSGGETGEAHVIAHSLTDSGQPELGYRVLGNWLERHDGSGSRWLHLHFHMGIFEIETGRWPDALDRLWNEILPEAVAHRNALTDGPALSWRLALAAPGEIALPWQELSLVARGQLESAQAPFETLHHLLALAGARDFHGLDTWARDGSSLGDELQNRVLRRTAKALSAHARQDYAQSAELISAVLSNLPILGGSQAQQGLFTLLDTQCRNKAETLVKAAHAA